MRGYAGFTIIGRIAKDPVMKTLENGTKRFTVVAAANTPYLKDNEWKENTAWVTFAWYGDQAVKMADRLHKGMWLFVTGEIRSSVEEVQGQKVTRYTFRPSTVVPFDVVTKEMRDQMTGGSGGADDDAPADGGFDG